MGSGRLLRRPITDAGWRRVVQLLSIPKRPFACVALVLRGACDQQMAPELKPGIATVRTHLRQARKILRVDDRVELVIAIVNLARFGSRDGYHHN